ncbi:GNAT family N-acetyltransferase [Gracilibacillus sp. YIM 98692]|uniref:GNAT family N-acetyltransferase n=1 Tax=Gracilibacillus sp. YIM 98692 TaxID=2663532 RepID=UPI0013D156C5|nr:GNAT family N-acetyltransferase [Gracilibacillus sp. YIM 98692]
MIRQLTEADDPICQALVQKRAAENLFIIGDIEAYGYHQDFQQIWGDFSNDGTLRAVLLKYEKNFLPFSTGDFDAKGFAEIINADSDFSMLSGLEEITEKIEPYLRDALLSKRKLFYAKLTDGTALNLEGTNLVKKLKVEEMPHLRQLLRSIPEFADKPFNLDIKKRNMENGVARCYYIEKDGEMVSTASTSAENTSSAMIVAVGTNQKYKRQGYATLCMAKLCYDLLQEGKELCLFYENPTAGNIYKRLGFQDIGYWMMYTFCK